MSRKRVLVSGASSQIGIFAIPRLVAAGFEITALSRAPRPAWFPRLESVSWKTPDSFRNRSAPRHHMLVSAGPIDLVEELLRQCGQPGRAVVFSTSSVESKRDSGDREERAQMNRIAEVEARLLSACERRRIGLAVFRPTLVYGCGMDENVSRLAAWIRKFGFMPLAGGAPGLRQPVHADDLAGAAVAALTAEDSVRLVTPLCGGSTLSFRQMVESIFRAFDKPVRTLNVPVGLLASVGMLAGVIPTFRGIRPEMVRRACRDLVFDDSQARQSFGYRPRRFEPAPADFELPSQRLLLRLAGEESPRSLGSG